MDILGERWTFLILRESFYGVRRFSDMQRNLGIARNILERPAADAGQQRGSSSGGVYQEEPERFEYRLTAAGRDLYPAIIAIMRWGDEHLNDTRRPSSCTTRAASWPSPCSCATAAASRCIRTTSRPSPPAQPETGGRMSVQDTPQELWGGETRKAVDNFPVSGERVPVHVVRWLGRIKGARRARERRARAARRRPRAADRRRRRRDRARASTTPSSRSTSSRPARARRRT